MTVEIFDKTACSLGEGPLWHPEREQFFWFDINAHRLFTRPDHGQKMWQFGEYVTAAGWVSRDQLLVASETALSLFDIVSGQHEKLCDLEADNPATRANDGRADPFGGFWIGTMCKNKSPDAGAIYRYYRGELRQLYAPWSIPNAISFTPDGTGAYFADTPQGKIWHQRLDTQGWPKGEPELFLDLSLDHYRPDGAVVDSTGNLWCAQNRHGKISVFTPSGEEVDTIPLPGTGTTCPAFGGHDLRTLFVTTAIEDKQNPTEHDGRTYCLRVNATGQAEYQVIL